MLSTDVVVAGGGVAGLLIASALAPELSVILLEQHDSLPRNKYWLTDAKAAHSNPHLISCVEKQYDFFEFIAYDGLVANIQGKYCLWDTDKLVDHLAGQLNLSGVKILTGHRFYTLSYTKDGILVRANSETIKSRLFIDCMGFASPLVGAKNIATISGYYVVHGCEVSTIGNIHPVALDNVVINQNPAYFELFPTSRGTAHAAIILPSRQHKAERSLNSELSFILEKSHYAKQIHNDSSGRNRSYYGIVPVGRLHRPALDRIVFFGESGQSNPAASATGLTRMLRIYQELALNIKTCIRTDSLDEKNLMKAIPPSMTPMNRLFHESLFESLLSFDSDDFRRLVRDLKSYPPEMVNEMLFADFNFQKKETVYLAFDALRRPGGVLGLHVAKSIGRFLATRLLRRSDF